ncbi:MAG: PBS lyase [Desulfobulbus propionicus]|nr:MAG: PBS lyase [Desulfobulbus propionicus]
MNDSKNFHKEISDEELLLVIADFLDMGHVDNIVAMFRAEPRYFRWTGSLLTDQRLAVRLGVSVLFEYLVEDVPNQTALALDSLEQALADDRDWVRGEALTVLGIIGGQRAHTLINAHVNDPAPLVREVAVDILEEFADD